MERKTMKHFMLGVCMLALTATAFAEVKVKPSMDASVLMGMYSDSKERDAYESDGTAKDDAAEQSHLETLWYGKLGMTVEEGKISGHANISTKSYDLGPNDSSDVDVWVKMQVNDQVAVKFDTELEPDGTDGFTATSGIGSELTFAKNLIYSLNAHVDTPGMEVEYKPNPYMGFYLGIYAEDPLFDDPNEAYAEAAIDFCSACDKTILTDSEKNGRGSGYSLSFAGALSKQLILGAGYVVGKSDQYDGRAPWNSTAYQFSAKYKFSDDISITGDYGSRSLEAWNDIPSDVGPAVDLKVTLTSMGLMFKIKAGPGELAAVYHTLEDKIEAGCKSELKALAGVDLDDSTSKSQETTLTYDISMCEEMNECGVKFIYLSDNSKKNASGADTRTKTWMGAQFYARY